MQIQKPWSPGASDLKYRKTACAEKKSMFVVECSGGCEGTEYIKLGADVIEGVVCYDFGTFLLALPMFRVVQFLTSKMFENAWKCLKMLGNV